MLPIYNNISYSVTAKWLIIFHCSKIHPVLYNGIKLLVLTSALLRFDSPARGWPVPVLFSSEPGKTERAFRDSAQMAYDCLHALVSNLYARQELTAQEAEAYLANPASHVAERPFKHRKTLSTTAETSPATHPEPGTSKSNKNGKEEKGNTQVLCFSLKCPFSLKRQFQRDQCV